MYGLITFVTRQTLAACQRSDVVAFRVLIDSRRASTATSSPILFRYLKQSPNGLSDGNNADRYSLNVVGFLAELERLF